MIITITGLPGSGKSTVAKELADSLGFGYHSVGGLMREIAEERGLTLMELGKLAENDKSIDKLLDQRQINLGKEKDDIIIDSRLGWYFIPGSVKIFLDADLEVSARRVFDEKRDDEGYNTSFEKTKENMLARMDSEKKRYKHYYGVDYFDKGHYDKVIDTSDKSIAEIVEKIKDFIANFK
ncbi:MAG: (d)CMP kinase [Nanobdellota archaeon]